MKDNNLLNGPGSIFSCDESGICLAVRPGKVIALKGMRNATAISSGNKMQITVLACVSASGHAIPPMVFFPGKNFIHQLTINEVPGTLYAMSPNGWMDLEIFNRWFEQHFLRYVPATRPILNSPMRRSGYLNSDLKMVMICPIPSTNSGSRSSMGDKWRKTLL